MTAQLSTFNLQPSTPIPPSAFPGTLRVPPSALAGLRVLDLAGPIGWYATRLFAGLGADVLRIELPDDNGRRVPPFIGESGQSLPHWFFNAGKRSLSLDLDRETDRDRFRELAARADLLVETRPPGWLTERGIGAESLRAANPGLVVTSITPFGQTGPYRDYRASDLIGVASGGLMYLGGEPTSPPSQPGGDQGYLQAGGLGAVASLMALYHRDRSGLGQHVDVSMQSAVAIDSENALAYYDLLNYVRPRLGTRNFYGNETMFEAKDGWFVCWFSGRWDQVLAWFRSRGLDTTPFDKPEWYNATYRTLHDDEVVETERALMRELTREEAYLEAQRRRIPAAPVVTVDELLGDPQLIARDFFAQVEIETPAGPRLITVPGTPFKLSRTPWRVRAKSEERREKSENWLAQSPTQLQPSIIPVHSSPFTLHSSGPLAGLRILDFTWMIAGPLATKLFADYGADVIKVETAVHPDANRRMPAPRPAGNDSLNVSGVFNLFNSSKRSITVNVTTPLGLAIVKRLIGLSDVVVDNYGVDPYPKWGLTPDVMLGIKPDLVIARAATMGRSGPRSDFIGNGYTIGAAAGLNSLTGFPHDPPGGTGIAHPDYSCNPLHLATAILAALRHRDRTGEGQVIDLGQHESTVTFAATAILDYTVNGRVAERAANRRPDAAPHGAYRCAGQDRWIAIACFNDGEWPALCRLIGRPELAEDPRFRTLADRKANEDALDAVISAWTAGQEHYEAAGRLQAAGVPAYPVADQRDLVERDPQIQHRRLFRQLDHPEAGRRWYHAPPFLLSATPGDLHRYSPLLGEDNDHVFQELLGLSDDEIAQGYIEGAFE